MGIHGWGFALWDSIIKRTVNSITHDHKDQLDKEMCHGNPHMNVTVTNSAVSGGRDCSTLYGHVTPDAEKMNREKKRGATENKKGHSPDSVNCPQAGVTKLRLVTRPNTIKADLVAVILLASRCRQQKERKREQTMNDKITCSNAISECLTIQSKGSIRKGSIQGEITSEGNAN